MRKLKLFFTVTFLLATAVCGATVKKQTTPYWLDPNVNRVNVEGCRASYFEYESKELAQKMQKEASSRFMSLDGYWKFLWVKDHNQAPADFWKEGYDDSEWKNFPVPGIFEINGYGDATYKNVGYAWATQFKSNPPFVEEKNNYTGSYRKEIEVPATWKGNKIFLHVGSATSNLQVWVNGKWVGYSEDSKAEAEFDVTKFMTPGKKNLIAMQVMRWCDGSYLEDQDFWKLSGIARQTYLYATPVSRISDIFVNADLTNDFKDGKLFVKAQLQNAAGTTLRFELKDKDGKTVMSQNGKPNGNGKTEMKADIKNPLKWTAETPNLYTFYATLTYGKDEVLEVVPIHVGFRHVEIHDGTLWVNGKAIFVKGVDRHEMDPDGGYVVGLSRMEQDIKIMKQLNINAVRTCHYIDDPRWYDLCDQYGIYLCAEANLESHGMGYGDATLAKDPQYAKAHLERNIHNIELNKNHPSIIIWSMGNEAGMGPNFEKVFNHIKAFDPSRPIMYERACFSTNKFSDDGKFEIKYSEIFCPMYYPYDKCVQFVETNKTHPLIQCEYSHAMGNSSGGFKEYWDMYRKYWPRMQGGFIWDYVDQGLRSVSKKTGREIFTFGGDYGRYPATDNNFNCNGLLRPDRTLNPESYEVGYYYQNIWTTPVDLQKGTVKVFNENFFKTLDDVVLEWQLLADGKEVASGKVDGISVAPHETKEYTLAGYSIPAEVKDKELLLNVAYKLKAAEPLMDQGQTVAYQQMEVQAYRFPTVEQILAKTAGEEQIVKTEQLACLNLTVGKMSVTFNKQTGWLDYLDHSGMALLEPGYSIKPDFWRAPTDNDYGAKFQNKFGAWKNPEMKLTSFSNVQDGKNWKVVADYDIPATESKLRMTYTLTQAGELLVNEKLTVSPSAKDKPYLPRFGMQIVMPRNFNAFSYYGRGPWENYWDRKGGAELGVYNQKVADQYWEYVRAQESGQKCDVRWWTMKGMGDETLQVYGPEALECSALNYLPSDLDAGVDKNLVQFHSGDLTPRNFTVLHVDKHQMGLGGINSWGAWPRPEYMLPYADYEYSFVLR